MKKSTFILILILLTCSFLRNIYTFFIFTNQFLFVASVIWSILGWIYYSKYKKNNINVSKNRKYFWIVLIIISLSTFIPLINYNQDLLDTIIAQRPQYAFVLFGFLFLRILPKHNDFIQAFKISSYISLIFFLISIYNANFFLDPIFINQDTGIENPNSTDIGTNVPGLMITAFYLMYCFQRLDDKPSKVEIIEAIVFLTYLIAYQNRSTLIIIIPLFIISLYKMKSKKKYLYIAIIGVFVGGLILPFIEKIYTSLSTETEEQLFDINYPRWQAIYLYMIEMKKDILTIIFGNGVWGRKGDYLKTMLYNEETRKTYISDLGILGTYFYYGIFIMILLYNLLYRTISQKSIPIHLKYFALWMIVVPTIHNFMQVDVSSSFLYASFFYLIFYNSKSKKHGRIDHNYKLQYV